MWQEKHNKLEKEFEFNNFVESIDFLNKITPLAEEMNHHPDVLIYDYKKVKISLSTHTENKVTEKDHELAKKIDRLA